MSSGMDLSFDPDSLKRIAQFAGFQTLLAEEVQKAMRDAGVLLADAAVANTWTAFAHPTGALASTIHPMQDSPYEVIISADSPYAMRREYGFVGMVDSLGRVGTDKATPYAQPALDANQQAVLILIDAAVERVLNRIAGGG